jgi:hypothetical protein
VLTGRRAAFPRTGAVAFGAGIAVATALLPPGRPIQPDPLLVVPVALAGGTAGWLLLGIVNWRVLAGASSLLVLSSVAGAGTRGPGGPLGLVVLTMLVVLAWIPGPAPPPPPEPPPRPDRVEPALVLAGRWILREGAPPGADRGGFSLVHLAEDRLTPGRLVVAKLPDPNFREQARSRLAREQEMLQRCRSRHIVRPVDAGVDPGTGRLFLILPWYEAGSLQAFLGTARAFPLGWALDVTAGVLRALVHLRDEQPEPIAHRDVNPRNVLLTKDRGRAVLCDFGSARYRTRPDDSITLAGAPYSAWYAAPELLARSGGGWHAGTDVYGPARSCTSWSPGSRPTAGSTSRWAPGSRSWPGRAPRRWRPPAATRPCRAPSPSCSTPPSPRPRATGRWPPRPWPRWSRPAARQGTRFPSPRCAAPRTNVADPPSGGSLEVSAGARSTGLRGRWGAPTART